MGVLATCGWERWHYITDYQDPTRLKRVIPHEKAFSISDFCDDDGVLSVEHLCFCREGHRNQRNSNFCIHGRHCAEQTS